MLLRTDEHYMQRALHLAVHAEQQGEVPVGCVIVLNDDIIGEGHKQPITEHDPSAHAEIVALRAAAQQQHNYRLPGATLYVTLEPCMMCPGAMIHARMRVWCLELERLTPKLGWCVCVMPYKISRLSYTI